MLFKKIILIFKRVIKITPNKTKNHEKNYRIAMLSNINTNELCTRL